MNMATELQFVAIAGFLLWCLVSSVCGMLTTAEEPSRLIWRERCPVGWGAWREAHFGLTAADRRLLLQQEPAVDQVAVDGLFRAVLSQDPNPDADALQFAIIRTGADDDQAVALFVSEVRATHSRRPSRAA